MKTLVIAIIFGLVVTSCTTKDVEVLEPSLQTNYVNPENFIFQNNNILDKKLNSYYTNNGFEKSLFDEVMSSN